MRIQIQGAGSIVRGLRAAHPAGGRQYFFSTFTRALSS
jgi:hypothetical protein